MFGLEENKSCFARYHYFPQLKARQSATPAAPAVRAVLPNRTWRKIRIMRVKATGKKVLKKL